MHQGGHTPGRSRPFGNTRVVVHDPAQCALYDRKSRRDLHDLAERHGRVEITGRAQENGDYPAQLRVGLGHDHGTHVLTNEVAPARKQPRKRSVELGALSLVAAKQRNALGVLARAGKPKAILSFRLVLAFGRDNETAADEQHAAVRDQCIADCGEYQKTIDGDRNPGDRDRELATDGPQHGKKSCSRQCGRDEPGGEIHRHFSRDAQVVVDAVLGIFVIAGNAFELIIAGFVNPAVEDRVVHPRAPSALHGHSRPHAEHAQREVGRYQQREQQPLVQHCGRISRFQGIEKMPVPEIDPVGDAEAYEHNQGQSDRQRPGAAWAFGSPIAQSGAAKTAKQLLGG